MVDPVGHERLTHLLRMEIRHIAASKLTKLSAIIDKAKAWGRLLDELTRPIERKSDTIKQPPNLKLSLEAITLIEQQFYCGKSPTMTLLNHWAITGRRRPTVWDLLKYLRICGLKWAEDYICQAILGIESIDQITPPPQSCPVAVGSNLKLQSSAYEISEEFKFDNLGELLDKLEKNCPLYSFRSIYESTNSFCDEPYCQSGFTGFKIGEGRFSSVFRARTTPVDDNDPAQSISQDKQQVVAAKLLKSKCNEKYLANEINLIGRVKHDSILELLGIALGKSSVDHDSLNYICLIYPFMQNGSLLDCLSLGLPSKNMEFLAWQNRIEIAIKVARGIAYLHSFQNYPIIHRDIKTANIFVGADLEPKVGDFTLMRQLDTIRATETQFSQNVIGTSVYMPPEAFRGDISIKFDTFSFGIVLIELLTGMRPFNEELGEDLFTFINEKLSDISDEIAIVNETIMNDEKVSNINGLHPTIQESRDKFLAEILDKKAGDWNFDSSKMLFNAALQAIESRKKNRPELSSLLPSLEAACSHYKGSNID